VLGNERGRSVNLKISSFADEAFAAAATADKWLQLLVDFCNMVFGVAGVLNSRNARTFWHGGDMSTSRWATFCFLLWCGLSCGSLSKSSSAKRSLRGLNTNGDGDRERISTLESSSSCSSEVSSALMTLDSCLDKRNAIAIAKSLIHDCRTLHFIVQLHALLMNRRIYQVIKKNLFLFITHSLQKQLLEQITQHIETSSHSLQIWNPFPQPLRRLCGPTLGTLPWEWTWWEWIGITL